jgi:hypothetical protein
MVACPRHATVASTTNAPSATPAEIDNCCPTVISAVALLTRAGSTSA